MALDRETVGLVFKIDADASKASAEIARFENDYKDALHGIRALLVDIAGGIDSQTSAIARSIDEQSLLLSRSFERARPLARQGLKGIEDDAKHSSRIAYETFVTASSEIIESWGVDGDIANEIGKMLYKMPATAKVAIGGVVAAFAVGIGSVVAFVKVSEKILDVSEKIGTKSKDDFNKLNKELKEAGFNVTQLDRNLAQNLDETAKRLKTTLDGLFLIVLRESGPDFMRFLDQATGALNDMRGVAKSAGETLGDAFRYAADWIYIARQEAEFFTSQSFLEKLKYIADMFSPDPQTRAGFIGQQAQRVGEGMISGRIKPPPPIKNDRATFEGKSGSGDPDANNKLRMLRLEEQAAERTAQMEIKYAQQMFDARRINIEQLVKLTADAEAEMLAAKLVTFEAERKEVEASKLRASDKAAKIAEINSREAAARQKAADVIADVERRKEKLLEDIDKSIAEAKAQREDDALKAEIGRIERAADLKVISYEQAARRIDDVERLQFDLRAERLRKELELAKQDLAERTRINAELRKLAQERTLFEEQAAQRRIDAQVKDLQKLREYLQARNQILEELRAAEVQALDDKANDLERRATNLPGLRGAADAARKDATLAAIDADFRIIRARIEADKNAALAAAQAMGASQKAIDEIIKESNDRLTQELLRMQRLRQLAEDEYAKAQERRDPLSARSFLGEGFADGMRETESILGGLKGMVDNVTGSLDSMKMTLEEIASGALQDFIGGLGSIVEAFVITGEVGPAALRKLTTAILANLAKQAAVNALVELAKGFGALFTNPAAAAAHFKSAALWGAAAAAAGFAGRAIAPSGGEAVNFSGEQRPGRRIIEQGDRTKPEPQIIIIRTEPGLVARQVKENYRNNGDLRTLIRTDVLGEAPA